MESSIEVLKKLKVEPIWFSNLPTGNIAKEMRSVCPRNICNHTFTAALSTIPTILNHYKRGKMWQICIIVFSFKCRQNAHTRAFMNIEDTRLSKTHIHNLTYVKYHIWSGGSRGKDGCQRLQKAQKRWMRSWPTSQKF